MISQIKITSKRQATLPVKLCKEMNVNPGDSLLVERSEHDGETVWFLRLPEDNSPEWFGALSRFATDKSHDMEDIRKSIARRQKRA